MGKRGELFTRKIFVKDGEKTYFFNIKENRYGDQFLNLVESSRKGEADDFKRNSIMIYEEDLQPFTDGFNLSSSHLKKGEKKNYSVEKGNESSRRVYHFSVKWNKFGWGSIFVSEERAGHVSDRRNETILVDERDWEDFMKGFEPAIARLREAAREKTAKKESAAAAKKKKITIKAPPKKAKEPKTPKRIVKAVKKD